MQIALFTFPSRDYGVIDPIVTVLYQVLYQEKIDLNRYLLSSDRDKHRYYTSSQV